MVGAGTTKPRGGYELRTRAKTHHAFRIHHDAGPPPGQNGHFLDHSIKGVVMFMLLGLRTVVAVLTSVHFLSGNDEEPAKQGLLNMWLLLYSLEAGAYCGLLFENMLFGVLFWCCERRQGSNAGVGLMSAQHRLRSMYFATAAFSVMALIAVNNYANKFSTGSAASAFDDAYTGRWQSFVSHSAAAQAEGLHAAGGLQTVFGILSIGGVAAISIVFMVMLEHVEQALYMSKVHSAATYQDAIRVAMGYGNEGFYRDSALADSSAA